MASASVITFLLNKALGQKGKAEWILLVTQVIDWETGSHKLRKLYFLLIWILIGSYLNGEAKFQMDYSDWLKIR